MELVRGHFGKLTGDFFVYSAFNPESGPACMECSGQFPDGLLTVKYGAVSLGRFIETAKPDSDFVKKAMADLPADIGKHNSVLSVYAADVHFSSEKLFLENVVSDILFAGVFPCRQLCVNAVALGMQYYVLRLKAQGADFINEILRKNRKLALVSEGYAAVKDHLLEYIVGVYVSPMVSAVGRGDAGEFGRLKDVFLLFGDGTPISGAVRAICNAMERSGGSPNIKVLEARLAEMVAVSREDYDDAAKKRDLAMKLSEKAI